MVTLSLLVILVFYCCVINDSKFDGIKHRSCIIFWKLMILGRCFLLEDSYALAVRWQLESRRRLPAAGSWSWSWRGRGGFPQADVETSGGLSRWAFQHGGLLDRLGGGSEFQKHVSLPHESARLECLFMPQLQKPRRVTSASQLA